MIYTIARWNFIIVPFLVQSLYTYILLSSFKKVRTDPSSLLAKIIISELNIWQSIICQICPIFEKEIDLTTFKINSVISEMNPVISEINSDVSEVNLVICEIICAIYKIEIIMNKQNQLFLEYYSSIGLLKNSLSLLYI